MAKVFMLHQVSGTRDGQDWPARGDVLDCPDDEAQQLIRAGIASEKKPNLENRILTTHADEEPVEAAVPDGDAETATVDTQPTKRAAAKK